MRPIFRLVPDFIIPSLENSTFGKHLQWEDRGNGSFKISRVHQSSDLWNEQCTEVYKAWSTKKKLWNASDRKRITRAKHRLITALRRNPDIEMLKKESAFYRFRIVNLITSDERESSCRVPTQEMEVSSTTKENWEDIEKYSNLEETEHREARTDLPKVKEYKNLPLFNSSEMFMNSVFFQSLSQPESYMQRLFPTQDYGNEFDVDEGKSTLLEANEQSEVSAKCCCDVLLDNVLRNQKCIWHGMPP